MGFQSFTVLPTTNGTGTGLKLNLNVSWQTPLYNWNASWNVKDGERGTGANLPISFTASNPYPNPFKNEISFSVTVLKETFISITIFDLLGREIRYIYDGRLLSGRYDYKWDSKNNIGVDTASGTYFIKISDGTNQEWKTITLIR